PGEARSAAASSALSGGATSAAAIRRPPLPPTWAAHSSPRSSTTFSKAGGQRKSNRLLHSVHDHSSTPCSSLLVRVIWCGVDKRTPISSGHFSCPACHAYPHRPC